MDYMKLQNGSDIRGIAVDGVPGDKVNLDETAAFRIGRAFAEWLTEKTESEETLRISIGRDPRISGEALARAFGMGAFSAAGCDAGDGFVPDDVVIMDCGLASTPAMFMSTLFDSTDCDGAVMITASHLPYHRNGFKFFTKGGGLGKPDIKAILEKAGSYGEDVSPDSVRVFALDDGSGLMEEYAAHLRHLISDGIDPDISKPLTGLRICVDAGNGAGGFYASDVLAPLGAEVVGTFLEPDGMFPNHIPNPEDKIAMAAISSSVREAGADLGLIFDTDVDRSAAVDENGNEIARNGIVALAAALVYEDHPGTTVVTDSITSTHLTPFLEEGLGMKHLRFKRGYKNVIDKSKELNENGEESWLAIETSGHCAFKDNYFLDDGAYLATKIVIKTARLAMEGKKISSMIADLGSPAEAREVRMKLSAEDFASYAGEVLDAVESYASNDAEEMSVVTPNFEGVRVNYDDGEIQGWFLLRKSLYEPLMPLNIESEQEGGCDVIAAALKKALADFTELDSSGL